MESAKVKNIVLAILLITNALLLGLMLVQRLESRHYRQQALQDAVDLLAQQGIQVQADQLPDGEFPVPQVLSQDLQEEKAAFAGLLGGEPAYTQRGLVSLYSGPLGTVEVWENGSFTFTPEQGAYPLGEQPMEEHALAVLAKMGFSGQVTETGPAFVAAEELLEGTPVFSCSVTLRYEGGQLREISGTRLRGAPSPNPQAGQRLSTATLLVRFRTGIIDSGDACTAILSATQGYVLSSDASRRLCLIPVLRLETDTNLYVLNALTGEWSRM